MLQFSSLTYTQSWLLVPLMDANVATSRNLQILNIFLKKGS